MKVPDKCLDCDHTIMRFEEVNEGFGKSHLDCVVRCDCFPVHYIVGCACAEIYCEKRKKERTE